MTSIFVVQFLRKLAHSVVQYGTWYRSVCVDLLLPINDDQVRAELLAAGDQK
jgi:hypothetical protein